MASGDFIRYDTQGVEPSVPNESEKIHALHGLVNSIQQKNFACHRRGFRGTHVKTQGIVKGKLTVLPDLPEHLSQGLFSNSEAEHDVAMRFANEPSFLQDDRKPGPRGCGMKVFDVDGEFMDPAGEESRSHDFTFNNAPLIELRDLPTCLEIFQLREKHFDDAPGLEKALKQREDSDLQFAPQGLPNRHFLSYTMYSQSAFRFGDYIAKYALFPTGKKQRELALCQITEDSDASQHSTWLREYHRQHEAEFDFRVQLLRNLDEQKIEDCSKPWDEETYPFETVARVVLPRGQDAFDPQRRVFWEDNMKLNPWYGLEAHRPMGSINRLRKSLYQRSVAKRNELNAAHAKVVSSLDQIP
ncbi:hypothetical protein Q7P37_000495 [Cladosporium fusiforme]